MYSRNDSNRFLSYQTTPPATAASTFGNAEERGPRSGRQRMSLLHTAHHSEYTKQTNATKQPSRGRTDVHLPLRIDIDSSRSGSVYNPLVEPISPASPSESTNDESPFKSTKEALVQQIARVDTKLAKTECQLAKLKKKKVELEETATQLRRETDEIISDSTIRSLAQVIYADNRKKASEAHKALDHLGPRNDLPLYEQLSDSPLYHENQIKYSSFKYKLREYIRIRLKEKEKREDHLTTSYANLSTQWSRKLEKLENNVKHRAKESKNREVFEKVFPELRKEREDKERFSRVASRIKSDADLQEIMDGLHEQELEDKKMKSCAVIPPILLDERTRKREFKNRNGLMEDPMQEYRDKQVLNIWTDQEKEIFKEKYLQHPKNFGVIKSFLERKSVADCVQYYYLSKKAMNYRQLVRKSRNKTRSSRSQHKTSNSGASGGASQSVGKAVGKGEPTGVTTWQQKEQKLDQQGPSSSGASAATSTLPGDVGSDTSDEENLDVNAYKGPHSCAVCKVGVESYLHSRPILSSQASQYGLGEEDVHVGDRVCTSCRCKAVRKRYKTNQCPIPTCPLRTTRTRLRTFPSKWADLLQETKQAICAKYQIPPSVTKCCTVCFNRINRRLSPNASLDTPDDPGSDTTRWTEAEMDGIKKALVEFGTNWRQLSNNIDTKSDLQCRNFYFNFRKQLGLDTLVQEFRKSKGGGDGPPISTDDAESGSTTSSCDEDGNLAHDHSRALLDKKDDYDSSATVSAEEDLAAESDKPIGKTSLKTLPNHPGSPLQLTSHLGINQSQQSSPDEIQPLTFQASQPMLSAQSTLGDHLTSSNSNIQIPQKQTNLSRSKVNQRTKLSYVTPNLVQQNTSLRYPSPEMESLEPMTVKDLMLATIVKQLRRNPVPSSSSVQVPNQIGLPPQSVSPTITSILKSQDRTHLPSAQPQLPLAQQDSISSYQELTLHANFSSPNTRNKQTSRSSMKTKQPKHLQRETI